MDSIINFIKVNGVLIAITISCIGAFFGILSYTINRRKISLDINAAKRDFTVGAEKIREWIRILSILKNTNPAQLTLENFNHDTQVFEKFINFYEKNEDKITKTLYTIASNLASIKNLLLEIHSNFKEISAKPEIYSPYDEKLMNYQSLFFYLSLLTWPVNILDRSNKLYKSENDFNIYYLGLYSDFGNYKHQLENKKIEKILNELDELRKSIGKSSR